MRRLILPVGPADHPVPGTVVLAAHPDDEIIGAGAALARLSRNAHVVYLTDGAPRDMVDASSAGYSTREAYARARRTESRAALRLAGIGAGRCRELGAADQESSLALAELTRRLLEILEGIRPEMLITHPYEGGHPDHDAAAFCAHAAARLSRLQGRGDLVLCEMGSYHADSRDSGPAVSEFLPFGPEDSPTASEAVRIMLTPDERALKREMIRCFKTQRKILEAFPLDKEIFRIAPPYDFTRPPHAGRLHYENFNWGMTARKWQRLAGRAAAELEIPAPRLSGPTSDGKRGEIW